MSAITLTRKAAGSYEYRSGSGCRYVIWSFTSGYGDLQWGCDVERPNGRTDYIQADTLAGIRASISYDQSQG